MPIASIIIATDEKEGWPTGHVEAHYRAPALPGFDILFVPGGKVREVRDRLRAACLNLGLEWPMGRITVNIWQPGEDTRSVPADLDVPILAAILAAARGDNVHRECVVRGELGLDGSLRVAADSR